METLISIISYFLVVVSFIFTLVGSELKKKLNQVRCMTNDICCLKADKKILKILSKKATSLIR